MWGRSARTQNEPGGLGCWEFKRDCNHGRCQFQDLGQHPDTYWAETRAGAQCHTDWYEGSKWAHGWFPQPAPALLGFDDGIHRTCGKGKCSKAGKGCACDKSSYNILQLFGNLRYNTCRNLEWQVCAAQGKLHGQYGKKIRFANAPRDMDLNNEPPFGCCHGWTDTGCQLDTNFANDDIYYLEVCLFSMICANRDVLFEIRALEDFQCSFDDEGFDLLKRLLLEGPQPGDLGGKCDQG